MPKEIKNLLFLTSHLPFPPMSGGRLREYELIKRLSKHYNIYLVVITKTYDDDHNNINNIHDYCTEVAVFSCLNDIEKKSMEHHYPDKILRIISHDAAAYIENILKTSNINLIHAEGFYMTYYLQDNMSIPIVLAEQNIEFNILEQEMNLNNDDSDSLKKEFDLIKKYELLAWERSNACISLTDFDYNIMKRYINKNKIHLIQNGWDHLSIDIENNAISEENLNDKTILLTGNFQYKPNIDAVSYFYNDLFPTVKNRIPEVKLLIVGNQPSDKIRELSLDPAVEIFPNVPDIKAFIKKATVFICPLRMGGGIKVKMLEAISCHVPIVTTKIGAQGLPITNPPGFLVAENDHEFIEQVAFLLEDVEARNMLKTATKSILSELNTWEKSINRLMETYETLA